ncbi:hypothetical protein HAX54_039631, partial [Datura stramonium]|nr:hypothetical protein [Datura stramonium]
MLPPNFSWGQRRDRGVPSRQIVDPVTENIVTPLSQPQNGTTADMIATMFHQAIESLVEKIQTQPQVVDVAREVETRWREERAANAQIREPESQDLLKVVFIQDVVLDRSHSRTTQTEGASIVQQIRHYKRDCPCNNKGPSKASTSMNGAPTNSVAYTARDTSGLAGRG